MPIAIAPVDGQVRPSGSEFLGQCSHQRTILVVDRALPTVCVVLLGNLQQPLPRDGLAPHNVLKKRKNVLAPFRTPERHEQNGVVPPRTHQIQYMN